MHSILVILHVFICAGLIGLVLIQHGKGADAGAAFGSGASSTVFGSQGSASFLTRVTAGLATAFFITSLILAYFSGQTNTERKSVINKVPTTQTAPAKVETPVTPKNSTELPPVGTPSTSIPATPASTTIEIPVPKPEKVKP